MRFRAVVPQWLWTIIAVFPALFTAACSFNHAPQTVHTIPDHPPGTFEQMTFKVLPPVERVKLELNELDPLFPFEGGLSRYEALVLPELPQPYTLEVQSNVKRDYYHFKGSLFFPVLSFLDADKQLIKTFSDLPYVMQRASSGRHYMAVSVQISHQLAAARYLLVHTEDEKLVLAIGREEGRDLLKSSDFKSMMFSPVRSPYRRYEFTPTGWVSLRARTPEQAKAKPPVEY